MTALHIPCHNVSDMGILFRYIIRNMVTSTVFITCGLACFVWLGQSLRFIEMIVRHRVGLLDYFQLVLYLLPDLIAGLLPIGLALGTISTLRNFQIHHEWRAMQAMGLSPWSLYKPFALISLVGAMLTFISGNEIAPWAFKHLKQDELAFKSQWTPTLSGSFQSIKNMTIYVQSQKKDGSLKHIFIDAPPRTFIAESGKLLRQGDSVGCHLHAGHKIEKNKDGSISHMEFDDIYYDFASFTEHQTKTEPKTKHAKPSEQRLRDLLWPASDLSFHDQVKMKSEGHQRLLQPLLVFLDVLIVFSLPSALLAGLCVAGSHLLVLAGLPIIVGIPWLISLLYIAIILSLGLILYRLYYHSNSRQALHL